MVENRRESLEHDEGSLMSTNKARVFSRIGTNEACAVPSVDPGNVPVCQSIGATALADNPLDGEDLLVETLFRRQHGNGALVAPPKPVAKPQHYKIVSISLYNEDLERLNSMVRELKRRGRTKANKSELIREALVRLDLDALAAKR